MKWKYKFSLNCETVPWYSWSGKFHINCRHVGRGGQGRRAALLPAPQIFRLRYAWIVLDRIMNICSNFKEKFRLTVPHESLYSMYCAKLSRSHYFKFTFIDVKSWIEITRHKSKIYKLLHTYGFSISIGRYSSWWTILVTCLRI